jgi:electron transport complex protein RnfC
LAYRLTFRGGISVDENKHTRKSQIQRMPAPARLSIPTLQHIGVPCTPKVKPGDTVECGQCIADVSGGLGCPVHSGVSGKVLSIEEKLNTAGAKIKHIVIENDFKGTISPEVVPFKKRLVDTTLEEIVEIVRRAGISGMGGATFPTYAKINSAAGKVNTLIVNCAECEPFITANHRLLLENPEKVINGTKILLKALGIRQGIIAVEDNKLDAINKLEDLLEGSELIRIVVLKTKYPQGDERQLIYAINGTELPSGKLPADVGCVIFNAETCASIFTAFISGMPLVERIVTVDGDCIKEPKNVSVTIGTSYRDLINFCGGLTDRPYKIIAGGPMMGAATWDIDAPVTKGTSALLVFSEKYGNIYKKAQLCIRCGRCAAGCPMHLMPSYLAAFSMAGNYEKCEQFDVMSCVECGACTYNCPGNVPIVQSIRAAKAAIIEKNKKAALQKENETGKKAEGGNGR